MRYLIGDIGNSLTKISIFSENYKLIKTHHFETIKLKDKIYIKKNLSKILSKNLNKKILFCSVVPEIYKKLKTYLIKRKFSCNELKQYKIKNIIKIKIKKFSQVGSDRLANAIGSYVKYKTNCVVIDFGTATTFDVIKYPGVYDGGVIAPGINLSIHNLNKFTALLPTFKLKKNIKKYGKNTKDALNAGFLWGYQGLINNILKNIFKEGGFNYKIILTGGYASHFKKHIIKKSIVDQNITVKGVMEVYKRLVL